MSNSIMRERYPILEMYQPLRRQLIEILEDDDLAFAPTGNPSLGDLCREMGAVQQAYIDSFRTFQLDFSRPGADDGLPASVAGLAEWYANLDRTLKEAVAGLDEEQIENRRIDRGGDFQVPPAIQLEIYREALHIFHGKVSVYLKALGKPLPPQWQEWIG